MFVLFATLLLLSGSAVAGIVAPNCFTSWSWTFNTLGQNVCTVAAYLLSTCNTGSFTIETLPPGYEYTGPSGADDIDLCKCNTVAYNLISACDACQGSPWITWSQYSLNCTTKLPPSSFPNPVPAGTRVPHWALLDPTPENTWNNITANATGDSPEVAADAIIGPSNTPSSSHSSGPTSTSASSASRTSATSASLTLTSSVSSASASPIKASSSNAGVITGGVVGGIVAISIAIVAVVYFARRQLPRASSATSVIDESAPPPQLPVNEIRQSLSTGPSYVRTPTPAATRPYDLDDQTTFHGYRDQRTSHTPAQERFSPYNAAVSDLITMQASRVGYHADTRSYT